MKSFQIRINNLRVHAQIGATLEEQILGQSLLIDLELLIHARLEKDLVSDTIDYGLVISQIRNFAASLGKVKLIETFATRMLDTLLESNEAIQSATAKVQKNYVPIQDFTGHVSITMSKQRDSQTPELL